MPDANSIGKKQAVPIGESRNWPSCMSSWSSSRNGCVTRGSRSASSSRGATAPARAASSRRSPSGSVRASSGSWPCPRRPSARKPDVHPALHAPLPGGRRDRHLRPQLVQPGRGRAGDGLSAPRSRRTLPAHGADGRAGDGRFRHHPDQVLAGGQSRGADPTPGSTDRRRTQDLEAVADGSAILQPLVRLLAGARRHVRRHRHRLGALVRGALRRQEARAAQHHPPSPEPDPLRGTAARAGRVAQAAESRTATGNRIIHSSSSPRRSDPWPDAP
jgi:hypothetical protein